VLPPRGHRHEARAPDHDGGNRRHRQVVVEADGDGFHERGHQRCGERGADDEGPGDGNGHRRTRPPGEKDARAGRGHDERNQADPGLVGIPRQLGPPDAGAGERGHAVARGEDAPRRGRNVEATREHQDQQQHGERVEQDAEREPAGGVGRTIESAPAEAWEHEGVEGERGDRAQRRLPPREHPQQQREAAHRHVEQLARRFGESARRA
jgi:hypothetical protein